MSQPADLSPIDAYLEGFEGEARGALEELRGFLRDAVPGAAETIAYGIPTLDLHGKHVVHFAGCARHVGLYPTPSGMVAFDAELASHARGKGSVRFPLREPLPADLFRRIAAFRVDEVAASAGPARQAQPAAKTQPAAETRRARRLRQMLDELAEGRSDVGLPWGARSRGG